MTDFTFIDDAIERLFIKLKKIDVEAIDISAYNKHYLLRYKNNFIFYMALYKQLMIKAINKLSRPVSEYVFVDYGGGCGMLSFLAKETGFKMVIYNDVYEVSVIDAFKIASTINIPINYFISGDAKAFVMEMNIKNLKPDLICSFDVLEHIYDWKLWIKNIITINNSFSLLFMTSANTANPVIRRRLKKIHYQTEYIGFKEDEGWKESDVSVSFINERKKIINATGFNLSYDEINMLAKQTRGLMKIDIEKAVTDYVQTGKLNYQPDNTTNTCDPYTGSWSENLININELKTFTLDNYLDVTITNAYYSYSENKLMNILKYFLNGLITIFGRNSLFFSPVYVLEIDKK